MMKKCLLTSIIMLLIGVPALLQADDTDIFGGGVINIPPNVLIMFDNSGSMEEWVPAQDVSDYDGSITYTGSFSSNRVYYQNRSSGVWYSFPNWWSPLNVESITCDSARISLQSSGLWRGMIYTNGRCGGTTWRTLATGNFRNFLDYKDIESRQKIDVAKETVNRLIENTDGVRFGLFEFNFSEGGRLISPLQTRNTSEDKAAMVAQVNSISASTWTPLAETLAEIGLYYARQPSWFNSGVNYLTDYDPAIQWRCQKNYIIIMTDGESTQDRNSKLWDTIYLNDKYVGNYIGDIDPDSDDPCIKTDQYHWIERIDDECFPKAYASYGSDYLDDVAKFLHDEDLLDGSFTDSVGKSFDSEDFSKQSITTYTIGFDIDHQLLQSSAEHGGGKYYTTGDNIPLSQIFEDILGNIMETNMIFVSPVVPVSRMNRTYADNGLYLGIFSPDNSNPGLWKGNLKKFGLSKEGEILDRDGNSATDSSGTIKENAKTAWYVVSGNEGLTVDRGGAGAVLKTQSSRVFRTFKDGTGFISFNKNNSDISPADFGLSTNDEKDDLMDFVTASGIYAPDYSGADALPREWVMGDILHSRPAILYDFTNSRNIIFVGANDGFLHCFVDNDQGTPENI
ncbi:MAG: VWA domain-containing protein, partial [Desulfomonilia bacterium]|nr:VWA domain-containing protein [Desulfomonilia bacterium]